jgi:hypothetical protein
MDRVSFGGRGESAGLTTMIHMIYLLIIEYMIETNITMMVSTSVTIHPMKRPAKSISPIVKK